MNFFTGKAEFFTRIIVVNACLGLAAFFMNSAHKDLKDIDWNQVDRRDVRGTGLMLAVPTSVGLLGCVGNYFLGKNGLWQWSLPFMSSLAASIMSSVVILNTADKHNLDRSKDFIGELDNLGQDVGRVIDSSIASVVQEETPQYLLALSVNGLKRSLRSNFTRFVNSIGSGFLVLAEEWERMEVAVKLFKITGSMIASLAASGGMIMYLLPYKLVCKLVLK